MSKALMLGSALILLDVMLPDHDGWYLLKEIRRRSQCPVIRRRSDWVSPRFEPFMLPPYRLKR
ncbi:MULTISPECIES: hypothetical protein [unclassified Paenibacillus]|uniref:hypothetical protein n=1 Tax=unclassified Paenibacillus TaxID=185978 RepID=UPI0030F5BD7C